MPPAPSSRRRFLALTALLLAAAALGALGQLLSGRGLAPDQLWAVLTLDGTDPVGERILWGLRLPRAGVALLAGAALGVSGLLLQTTLRNPLASPELTGVGGGAVLGVLLALRLGLASGQAHTTVVAAMLGGLAGGALLWLLAGRRRADPVWLTINGVIVGVALAGANAILLVLSQAEAAGAMRWLTGSLTGMTTSHLALLAPWALAGLALAWVYAPVLEILHGGDEHAASVGLAPSPTRLAALSCAVLLASAAVAVVGVLGFVGLLAPLIATSLVGRRPRQLVVLSALVGAAVVAGADAVAQAVTTLVPTGPQTQRLGLPAGSVTAVGGAALLVWALRRHTPHA
ncbi:MULTISPECIES: iron chelate uptake ABC transporter family permease subunit [unclassified Nocardiopsis]|uniref:iron chelate uptake ABC transporter family permease subunit n=1 Tax=unclassified Nocardiopsis TaxID=2649073 RepID=UPI00135AAEC7|nr:MULTISPECIES: iron chelate uptake ABC transporter family permease subunit [unclassified Nocardiopsis]